MSIAVLLGMNPEGHHAKHDLESLLHVIVFICTMYAGPGRKKKRSAMASALTQNPQHEHPFSPRYDTADMTAMGQAKMTCFFKKTNFRDVIFSNMTKYFSPLQPMLEELCDVVFFSTATDSDMRDPTKPHGTHSAFKEVLLKYWDDLPELDENLPEPEETEELEETEEPDDVEESSHSLSISSSWVSYMGATSTTFPFSVRSDSAYFSNKRMPTRTNYQPGETPMPSSSFAMILRSDSPQKRSSGQTGNLSRPGNPKRMRSSGPGSVV